MIAMDKGSTRATALSLGAAFALLLGAAGTAPARGAEGGGGAPAAGLGDGRVSPFYVWTGPLPSEPGRLLRREALPGEIGLAGAGEQSRILYTATDGVSGHGMLAVSGALFLPKGTPPRGGWPVIAWAHGTVGIADICAPSWMGRSLRDIRYLNAWLEQGYAVVATDYQGLGTPGTHPYIQTRPAAYSVLDAVRAALKAEPRLANRVVVVGQSQGGGAAFATGAFQPAYAPDVHLLGVVATGTPYIAPKTMQAVQGDAGGVDPTLAYLVYLGLTARADGGLAPALFTDASAPILTSAQTHCLGDTESDVRTAELSKRAALRPEATAKMGALLPALSYPTLHLAMPVFLGTGGQDHDVPTATQVELAKDSCAAGSAIAYHFYPDQNHSGTVGASLPDSTPFVRALMDGKPVASNCGTIGR